MKYLYSTVLLTAVICISSFAQPYRNWGTYYGGTGDDNGRCVAVDNNGNVYVAGSTSSAGGISTGGSYQSSYGGGTFDAFLVKFNSSGVRQWGTYYGGGGTDFGNAVAVDANGNVYLGGYTNSSSAISTVGSHQSATGGNYDAFLVQFNGSGVRQWATYYGGTSDDFSGSITIDNSNNVYLDGFTSSLNAISTVGSHQAVYGGGTYDGYLVKFNNSGVRSWGTYYGGTTDDRVTSAAVDASGNIYFGGNTNSTTAISTVGSHQAAIGGAYDDFLVKFNSAGVRQWATYYGGASTEDRVSIALDLSGNIYFDGFTSSATGIGTVGSYQPNFIGGNDAFLAKFNSSGVRQWGTYYGGTVGGFDVDGYSIAVDVNGSVYMPGNTNSTTGISTGGSHQTSIGGATDAFLVQFNSAGNRQWCTYYGGTSNEQFSAVAVDANGYVYLTGGTPSTTAISTVGSHQAVNAGGANDGFLVKFVSCLVAPAQPGSITGPVIACNGATNTYSISAVSTATSYTWILPSGWTGSSTTTSINATASSTSGNIIVIANNTCGTSTGETLAVSVNVVTASTTVTAALCFGDCNGSAMATAGGTGPFTYLWSNAQTAQTATGLCANVYTVTVTGAGGCTAAVTATVTEPTALTASAASTTPTFCAGGCTNLTVTATGGTSPYTYLWMPGSMTTMTPNVCPTVTTTYSCTVTDSNNCTQTAVTTVSINPLPTIAASGVSSVCEGANVCFASVGALSYAWSGPCGYTSTQQNPCITPIAVGCGGTYTVTGTDANGCSNTATVSVTVNPLPTVSISADTTTTCINWTADSLSGTPVGGVFSGPGVSGSNFNSSVAGAGAWTVTYTYTDVNGCTNTAAINISVALCTGIESLESNSLFTIFPNPSNGIFNLKMDQFDNEPMKISVSNVLGEEIFHQQFDRSSDCQIDLSAQPKGIYFLKVQSGERISMQKIIVE